MGLELNKFKPLLGIEVADTSQDVQLTFILDDVTNTILNYCNLKTLPKGLETTAYRMAMDVFRNESIGTAEYAGGSVSSISEGDTSVGFAGGAYADSGFSESLLKNYIIQLNNFRRIKW